MTKKFIQIDIWQLTNIQTVYFPPAHWRLILLIHDFILVIGGKLHSEYLVFFYWWQIILGTFAFFFTGGQVADTYHMFTKYSK